MKADKTVREDAADCRTNAAVCPTNGPLRWYCSGYETLTETLKPEMAVSFNGAT